MAEQLSGALAVFVKTPGLSPIKTRLAADIGEKKAAAVYEMLLQNTAATMRRARRLGAEVFWAVGEKEGSDDARWSEFPAMWTGGGGLGERLNRVYARLQKRHGRAALAGADCPAMSAALIARALRAADSKIAAGPTTDGGFYLFAAARPVAPAVWKNVPYSQSDTLTRLLQHFPPNEVEILPTLTDVDDAATLAECGLSNKIE